MSPRLLGLLPLSIPRVYLQANYFHCKPPSAQRILHRKFSKMDSAPPSTSAQEPAGARIDLSLDRITTLLKRLGSPQNRFPVIHIAGTNGKGSTSAYLDSILRNVVGLSTGRFNSPHLVEERDCCRLNGEVIAQDVWEEAGKKVHAAETVGQSLQSTPFEILVARMFTSFASLPANLAPSLLLVEVGLGGRLDATNVLSPRNVLASVICPVDLDHEALLGNNVESIAREKAGIIPKGGLCVIADQRKLVEPQSLNTELDLTSVRAIDMEKEMFGQHAGTVLDAIRNVALLQDARVAKGYVPWHALDPSSMPFTLLQNSRARRPRATIKTRYSPTLFPSVLFSTPTHLVARTGDPAVSGPSIQVPATLAALTGACTALQTLFSIARDEPPSAFGAAGQDENENIKLQIAFAMREDRETAERIQQALEAVQWEGRCAWLELKVPVPVAAKEEVQEAGKDAGMEIDQTDAQPSTSSLAEPATASLQLLVDGAHNPSSAQALRRYVDLSLPESGDVTITWIMGFSKGKDIGGMLEALLRTTNDTKPLADSMAKLSVGASGSRQVRHRFAFVPFSTPVEGMPWVQPAQPEDCLSELDKLTSQSADLSVEDKKTFGHLSSALQWAAQDAQEQGNSDLVVVCGSLYLVSDVYRLQRSVPQ